jgi:hypothetical protein
MYGVKNVFDGLPAPAGGLVHLVERVTDPWVIGLRRRRPPLARPIARYFGPGLHRLFFSVRHESEKRGEQVFVIDTSTGISC